ncbi:Cytochrome c oxidase polypeptide VIIc [Aphelenchoides besseyi]|nr:Cytochrome c oxidase polypeptide VIIc [Aphelenchoides besseyi]
MIVLAPKAIFRPLMRSVRRDHHLPNHGATLPDMTKWKPQTPDSFIYDGYALARLPFSVSNRYTFFIKFVGILAVGFWIPFFVVEYQLRKANQ